MVSSIMDIIGRPVPKLQYYVDENYITKEMEETLQLYLHTARGKISFFDEYVIIARDKDMKPILTFTYRDPSQWEIKYSEYEHLLPGIHKLKDGEIKSCDDAEWSDFDIIVKISENLFLLVNNTGDSIEQIEEKNPSVTWDMGFKKLEQLAYKLQKMLKKR